MAGLTAACMLSHAGHKVRVLEQNYLPGGCTSSYWRKGYVFEAGATTVVGLDRGMPLHHVLHTCGISVPAQLLEEPMQVRLANGTLIHRKPTLEAWIAECERVFGTTGQAAFWRECHGISQFVWDTSLKQLRFPPERITDLLAAATKASLYQVRHLPYAFSSTYDLLRKHGLHEHKAFMAFVEEQLIITAQNSAKEVNALFGATALSYTLVGNYYVPGGLLELVTPMVNYIEAKGGQVLMRHAVTKLEQIGEAWQATTAKGIFKAKLLVSALPINNTVELLPAIKPKYQKDLMSSQQVASAFQMGLAFKPHREHTCLHHQLHLPAGLSGLSSGSIFVSLSHAQDSLRSDVPGHRVASVSTHVHDPAGKMELDKDLLEEQVLDLLEEADLIKRDAIVYKHSSGPSAWQKWTGRSWGFVGGYPQYKHIKPWQMIGHRLRGVKHAYLCGDTTYPGQGIPGACLSGLIAAEKLLADVGAPKH